MDDGETVTVSKAIYAAVQQDAARYQWLREFRGWPFAESPGWTALDAAIDEEMAKDISK